MAQATVANGTNTLDDDYGNDLEPDSQRRQASLDRERDLNIFRSGSAPPTVEGSTAALDSLFCRNGNGNGGGGGGATAAVVNGVISEEETMMISNPDYLSYYNYNKNLNPRLPPPSLTKDEWILMQRFKGGAVGDRGSTSSSSSSSSSSSLFSLQPGGISINHGSERRNCGFDAGRKSFAEALQGDLGHSATFSKPISRPGSRSVIGSAISPMGGSDSQVTKLQKGLITLDDLHFGSVSPRLVRVQSLGSSISQSFASGLDSSPSRSMTPDPQLIRRSPSPSLPPIGSRIYGADKKAVNFNGLGSVSSHIADSSVIASSLADLSFSDNIVDDGEDDLQGRSHQSFTNQPELLMRKSGDLSEYMQQNLINRSEADSLRNGAHPFTAQNGFLLNNGTVTDHDISKLISNGQIKLPRQTSSNNLYSQVPSVGSVGSSTNYRNVDMRKFDYSPNREVHSTLNTQLDPGVRAYTGGAEQHLNRAAHQMDPLYAHYIKLLAAGTLDPIGTSVMDLSRYPKAYLEALLAQQKLHHGMPFLNKSGGLNHGFYGNPATGLGYPYPSSPTPSSALSSLGTGIPLKQNDQLSCFPSMVRGTGSIGSWNTENGLVKEGFVSSLLDEFKINKSRSFDLSEIVGHVVEFSVDQYGSRFIQQKLETAAVDEKNKIFTEILPFARDLMTDVFGNYVIQKFFEHGTKIQRKQLASQLMGHVLPLSFQMYGCRVIQKALEVVDVDQQTQMVAELDGSVLKCVHDQNGNHVIQKCIECVPQEKIQFIISAFYGQVVTLSTHPYGCRVIQRVLEHCDDAKIQSILMDEILQSVCTLSQDQYGNYVVQHVLQHGKQKERSAIIRKLAGQIVDMSQQKFASNVVEKCLTYGSPEDRQLLINEMLGSTDENEPLQVMMKDQFGNYVVQKVLETCNDENHELILSRIRVHLNTLKRYIYGKHIVARVEKLLTTGERRSAVLLR